MCKVDFKLSEKLVRELTGDFPGWSAETPFEIELCQFKTNVGKGKDFYRICPEGDIRPVIVKVFPEQDGYMGMTEDRQQRELAFVESDLYQQFGQVVAMPKMAVRRTEEGIGLLAMEDVSEELTLVGPPTPPTPALVREMITTIGKIHQQNWQKRDQKYDWLMNFQLWFERGVELIRLVVEGAEQPDWAAAILQDQPGFLRGMAPFLESRTEEDREKFLHILNHPEIFLDKLGNVPVTLGHNDLFFTNLGLRQDEILLIDWEFVGVSPAPWDISCSYAGMPPVGVDEDEMLELYFAQIPQATEEEKQNWLAGYRIMDAMEALIYGLRQLIPALYDPESKVPAEVKPRIEAEIDRVMAEIVKHV